MINLGMNSHSRTKMDMQIVRYLFYMWLCTYGEPDLLTVIIQFIQSHYGG